MFDIGFAELLVLVIIGMVVIGPEKLPTVMRTVGKTVGQARRFMSGIQNQIEQEVKLDELNKKIMAETKDMQDSVENAIKGTEVDSKSEDDQKMSKAIETENSIAPPVEPDFPEPPSFQSAQATNQTEASDDTNRS